MQKLLLCSLLIFSGFFPFLRPLYAEEVRRYSESETAFMKRLCDLAYAHIKNDPLLPKDFDFHEAERYLSDIVRCGDGIKVGTDHLCRPVCVTVQGALEKVLADMKKSGDVIDLSAVYITPLPATPLRSSPIVPFVQENLGLQSAYSVTLRQNTVREMRTNGGRVFCVYSLHRYNTDLKSKALEQLENKDVDQEFNQLAIYLNELNHHNTFDIPLNRFDLGGYVGAIYCITTSENQKYYMITEGTQVQDAGKEGLKMWRHSLIPHRFHGHERMKRIESIIREINECKVEDSAFILF